MNRLNKRVFLDYASTTPVESEVFKLMSRFWKAKPVGRKGLFSFGNPSAFYFEGNLASEYLQKARAKVANVAGVKSSEVIFTGSGTESDNLALIGFLKGLKSEESLQFKFWQDKKPHIVVSEIEHPAILETCKEIENSGLADVTYVSVLENGLIDSSSFKKYLRPETILVSIILANNEIGVVQPLRNLSKEIKKYKNELGRSHDEPPFIHTDASQAPCFLDINLDRLGVSMMTLDGSKIYGPKGVGCLIKKSFIPMGSIMFGGGQESRLRPGTENLPLIYGFAVALEKAAKDRENFSAKMSELQKYFIEKIEQKIPQAKINGTIKKRLPNNINICIPGLNSEFAVIQLDEKGIACSAMTACKSVSEEARSYVVDALYKNTQDCGASSLRFTFGKYTKKSDIDFAIEALSDII